MKVRTLRRSFILAGSRCRANEWLPLATSCAAPRCTSNMSITFFPFYSLVLLFPDNRLFQNNLPQKLSHFFFFRHIQPRKYIDRNVQRGSYFPSTSCSITSKRCITSATVAGVTSVVTSLKSPSWSINSTDEHPVEVDCRLTIASACFPPKFLSSFGWGFAVFREFMKSIAIN